MSRNEDHFPLLYGVHGINQKGLSFTAHYYNGEQWASDEKRDNETHAHTHARTHADSSPSCHNSFSTDNSACLDLTHEEVTLTRTQWRLLVDVLHLITN